MNVACAFAMHLAALSITNMESVFLTIAREDEIAVAAANVAAGRGAASPESATVVPESALDIGIEATASKGGDAIAEMRMRAHASQGSQFSAHFLALGQKRLRLAWRDRWGCCFQFLIPIIVVLIGMGVLSNSGERMPGPSPLETSR